MFLCPLVGAEEDGFETIQSAAVEAHFDHAEDLRQSDIIDGDEGIVVQPAKPMVQPIYL